MDGFWIARDPAADGLDIAGHSCMMDAGLDQLRMLIQDGFGVGGVLGVVLVIVAEAAVDQNALGRIIGKGLLAAQVAEKEEQLLPADEVIVSSGGFFALAFGVGKNGFVRNRVGELIRHGKP